MSRTRAARIVLIVVGVILALLFGFTVVSTEQDQANDQTFDPVAYVDGVWGDIGSNIRDGAVDIATILSRVQPDADGRAAKEDLTAVAQELGVVTVGEALVFKIKATGTVTDVDTSTSRGTMGLTIDGYDGPVEVRAYIGKRIPSDETSIRDAAGFIAFGDFREQTEYGKVASEINKRVLAELATLDPGSLVGQQVSLTGAFTLRTFNLPRIDMRQVTLVPLEVDTP